MCWGAGKRTNLAVSRITISTEETKVAEQSCKTNFKIVSIPLCRVSVQNMHLYTYIYCTVYTYTYKVYRQITI